MVLHIFSGDLWAGAEVVIYYLLKELRKYPDLKIIALSLNEGILRDRLRKAGIETHVIAESSYSFPQIYLKALVPVKDKSIDIIHSHR